MPVGRVATLFGGAMCLLPWSANAASALLLLLTWAVCVTIVAWRPSRMISGLVAVWCSQLVILLGVVSWLGLADSVATAWRVALGLIYFSSVVAAWRVRENRCSKTLLLFWVTYVLAMLSLATTVVEIDVQQFLEGALDALLEGTSPYSITITPAYSAEELQEYFPDGPVEDGRIPYGFPYLPAALLLDLPAHLLGEVRWMHVLCLCISSLTAWKLATDRPGRIAALSIGVSPVAALVLVHYWIEPVLVMLLTVGMAGMVRGRRGWTGLALGMLFASKQYAVSFVPVLWSVGRRTGWSTVLLAAAAGTAVAGVFFVWDPGAFIRSTIDFPFLLGVRSDSVSLLPQLHTSSWGPLPSWAFVLSPLAGVLTGGVVAWRTRPGATAVCLGVGLSLLVTFLLAKQAFVNYYLVAGVALLLAGIIWPEDDPTLPRSRDSGASRVHEEDHIRSMTE